MEIISDAHYGCGEVHGPTKGSQQIRALLLTEVGHSHNDADKEGGHLLLPLLDNNPLCQHGLVLSVEVEAACGYFIGALGEQGRITSSSASQISGNHLHQFPLERHPERE